MSMWASVNKLSLFVIVKFLDAQNRGVKDIKVLILKVLCLLCCLGR